MRTEQAVRKRAYIVVTLISILGIVAAVIVGLNYSTGKGIDCPVNAYTGYYCPACGLTRMAVAILKLDFISALRYNPFILLTSPYIAYLGLVGIKQYILFGEFSNKFGKRVYTYVIALILFGILRNIDTFSFLAPR